MSRSLAIIMCCIGSTSAQDLASLEEQAFKRAVARAGSSLVQIETVGGLDRVAGEIEGASTTGLVVSRDGEILTSAFVFATKPSSILVRLADGRRLPATKVATDHVTQLTLLKVEAADLKTAAVVSPEEIKVGHWSLALGRTLDTRIPSVSVGIISAVNRVWGKAIQTDAKVSPVNYGGALVDVSGRVQGVLVPMSPQSGELMAGVEWYDSGIGFAIPIESAMAAVRRLRAGSDLKRGLLGVTFEGNAIYGTKPKIDLLRYDSPAEKAGMKKGDIIVSVEGKPTARVAQVRHALGNKYAGESVAITFDRDGKQASVDVQLVAVLPPWNPGFLGVLPQRRTDAAGDAGVRVRFVVPDSPAAVMGLAAGDLITSLNGNPVIDRDALASAIGLIRPETEVAIGFLSNGENQIGRAELRTVPDDTIASLPDPELSEPADPPEAKTGRLTETFETHEHEFWAYVPESYNPIESYGLVVWLHPSGDTMEARILQDWKSVCDSRGLILVAPKSAKPQGWNANEMPFVKDTIELMQSRYSIDPRRVVVHGHKSSASLAFALTFQHRAMVRGLIVVGGGLRSQPPENRPEFPLQVCLFGGQKDPEFSRVKATAAGLKGMKYPVTFANSPASGSEYPSADQVETFGRWIDSLDRI